MHELSIAMSILDCADEESANQNGAAVMAIHLRLGALSGVVKEALVGAFELARECSESPRAELVIEELPVIVHCKQCGENRPIVSIQEFCCVDCGTPSADVVQGRELEVVALEIES